MKKKLLFTKLKDFSEFYLLHLITLLLFISPFCLVLNHSWANETIVTKQADSLKSSSSKDKKTNEGTMIPVNKTKGEELFVKNCSTCHGKEGRGDGPVARAMGKFKPRNFTKDPFKFGEKPEEVLNTLKKGIPGTPMPSWSHMKEEELKALVGHILSLRPKK